MTTYLSVETTSGSTYDFRMARDGEGEWYKEVRRRNSTEPLRRDGEWLKVLSFLHEPPNTGDVLVLELEPLGEGPVTTRVSTPIVSMNLTKVEDEEN